MLQFCISFIAYYLAIQRGSIQKAAFARKPDKFFLSARATDRPDKKGKTLSEAIKIMSFMKKDQHIDPDLFDLFQRSGVYRHYAERVMKPEQIDEVDVGSYLAAPPAAKPV